jgi:hypothetical protein
MSDNKTLYVQSGHSIPVPKNNQVRFIVADGKPFPSNLAASMGSKRVERLIEMGVLGEKVPSISDEIDKSVSAKGTVRVPRSEKGEIDEGTFSDADTKKDKKDKGDK